MADQFCVPKMVRINQHVNAPPASDELTTITTWTTVDDSTDSF